MVLDSNICKEQNFTRKNTLLIDSEADKILDDAENSIVIKPYEAQDVIDNKEDQGAILINNLEYILSLLEETTSDVRDFIKTKEPEFSQCAKNQARAEQERERQEHQTGQAVKQNPENEVKELAQKLEGASLEEKKPEEAKDKTE